MNSSILKEYSKEITDEVKDLLVGFSDSENLGLLVALMTNGKMSFNEMKKKFQISPSSLTNRLTVLQDGNLVENFYAKTDNRVFSYYRVTELPEQILESVHQILYSLDATNNSTFTKSETKQATRPASEQYEKSQHPSKVLHFRVDSAATTQKYYSNNLVGT